MQCEPWFKLIHENWAPGFIEILYPSEEQTNFALIKYLIAS